MLIYLGLKPMDILELSLKYHKSLGYVRIFLKNTPPHILIQL